MKAVFVTAAGGPEVLKLKDVPQPVPGDNEILVHIKAAGINVIDTKIRPRGTYHPDRLPSIIGCDAAGVVEQTGKNVKRFKRGDEVYYCYGGLGAEPGSYAEFNAVPELVAAHKPKSLTFVQAAAAPLVSITAWEALHDRARVQPGQKILIQAGAGGVGHMAVQVAKAAGCSICTTVDTEEKAEFVKSLGAERPILFLKEDFVKAALDWSGGKGVDAALDTVGGSTFTKTFSAVKFYGDIVTIVGVGTEIDWKEAKRRNQRISVVYMPSPMIEKMSDALKHQSDILGQCAELFDAGKLRVFVNRTFPLEQAADAHRLLEQGTMTGKLVLVTE